MAPLGYSKRYPVRFEMFRVKDGEAPDYEALFAGAGTIEFARIFSDSEQAGLKHYVVELQAEPSLMNGAEDRYRHVKQAKFWCFSLPE
jgi:sugar phosphate isomerase/epimerase